MYYKHITSAFWTLPIQIVFDDFENIIGYMGEKITAAIRRNEMAPARCHTFCLRRGTSINDVPRFLAIFDLPTYPTYLFLLYNVQLYGLSWTPLPTLISDVINGGSQVGLL
jgi:hypothetical protein